MNVGADPRKLPNFGQRIRLASACLCDTAGLDQEPGREGGTWFGASRHGRIACLVNISAPLNPEKRGRGYLVSHYLTKGETIESYAEEVASQRDLYNGFTLTLIEVGQRDSKVARVTNDCLADSPILLSQPAADEFFGVGNSPIKCPWRKVCEGQKRFEQIVKAHPKLSMKEKLKEELFRMMRDDHRYSCDSQLEKQGRDCGWNTESIQSKASIFVWEPGNQYGTRTTTVLLIDEKGQCDYTEKTLVTPVDVNNPQWTVSHHNYNLLSTFPSCL